MSKVSGNSLKEFAPEEKFVDILGKSYKLREMSLAEKIRVFGPVADEIAGVVKSIQVKRRAEGGFGLEMPENISLGDLKVDSILMSSIERLPEILRLSIPDFKDWDNIPESAMREPLVEVMALNDFMGFALNFTTLAGTVLSRLVRR